MHEYTFCKVVIEWGNDFFKEIDYNENTITLQYVRMIDVNPAILNLDTGKIGEILTKQMGIAVSETGKHCDIADGGGWEIVSHRFTILWEPFGSIFLTTPSEVAK